MVDIRNELQLEIVMEDSNRAIIDAYEAKCLGRIPTASNDVS